MQKKLNRKNANILRVTKPCWRNDVLIYVYRLFQHWFAYGMLWPCHAI